jgi:hypothetical protein
MTYTTVNEIDLELEKYTQKIKELQIKKLKLISDDFFIFAQSVKGKWFENHEEGFIKNWETRYLYFVESYNVDDDENLKTQSERHKFICFAGKLVKISSTEIQIETFKDSFTIRKQSIPYYKILSDEQTTLLEKLLEVTTTQLFSSVTEILK